MTHGGSQRVESLLIVVRIGFAHLLGTVDAGVLLAMSRLFDFSVLFTLVLAIFFLRRLLFIRTLFIVKIKHEESVFSTTQ